jgi:hypothetical protein
MDFVLCAIHSLSDCRVIGAFDKYPKGNFMGSWNRSGLRAKKKNSFSKTPSHFRSTSLFLSSICITLMGYEPWSPQEYSNTFGNCDKFAPLDVFVFSFCFSSMLLGGSRPSADTVTASVAHLNSSRFQAQRTTLISCRSCLPLEIPKNLHLHTTHPHAHCLSHDGCPEAMEW